jgi:hypothetical protein
VTDDQNKLIVLLTSIAMYNDRGRSSSVRYLEDFELRRQEFRRAIDELIIAIGTESFHPQLLLELRGELVLRDWTGIYVDNAITWFCKRELVSRT